MVANIQEHDEVTLKSFHGSMQPPPGTDDSENYWKLIGLSGVVIDTKPGHPAFPQFGERALVRFEHNLKDYDVHCHNPAENSLWIFVLDLDKAK